MHLNTQFTANSLAFFLIKDVKVDVSANSKISVSQTPNFFVVASVLIHLKKNCEGH